VGMGQKNCLGFFLVGDFIFDYFMGSIPKSMVVGFFANNASILNKNTLSMVDWLGF